MKRRLPRLRSEKLANATALAAAAAVMLVPANLLPVITTHNAGTDRTDTIFSGTVQLWQHDLQAIAIIVFTASILIPFLKLAGLAWLLVSAQRRARRNSRRLTQVYAVLDFIGRWSMLDVFLVAFLSGIVQFGALASIEPRGGIVAFAVAVVLTVLATQAFDPRVLWREPASATPHTISP
jgi:paraquat-inducible protein A